MPVCCIFEKYEKGVDWDGPNATLYIKDKAIVNPDENPDQTSDSTLPENSVWLADVFQKTHGWYKSGEGACYVSCKENEAEMDMKRQYNKLHLTMQLNTREKDISKRFTVEIRAGRISRKEYRIGKDPVDITIDISNYRI